jgi:imidazole glycerol-phosphate synthase subunit HisH
MKVAIVNYGMGNLGSVRRALEDLGASVTIADHPAALFECHRAILPGVGAFAEGMERLRAGGWTEGLRRLVRESGRPLLGICLGMQMLADEGDEGGLTPGLGLVPGRVRRLDALGCALRIPHVGWNDVTHRGADPLFAHVAQGTDFYFVHSYALVAADPATVSATVDYGATLTVAVRSGNVFGTQFHPEKSSRAGRQLLRNFLDYAPC